MSGLAGKLSPLFGRYSTLKAVKPFYASFSTYPRLLSAVAQPPATRYPHDAPERDFVNYPPPRLPTNPGKLRLGVIPNEWFEALYDKTGVTGPYLLVWGGFATLLSKEYFVYWVDTLEHLVFLSVVVYGAKKFGPKIAASLDKEVDTEEAKLRESFASGLTQITKQLAAIEAERRVPEASTLLFEAKRENVGLQLEASYRERVQRVYEETKRRLDYQVALQNAQHRLEKQEMLTFILGEVNKSIGTAKQEREFMQSCLSQLRTLSTKYANTI